MSATATRPPQVLPSSRRARRGELWPALLLAFAAVVILWAGRGTAFMGDEWAWIFSAVHPRAASFLDPYNGHLIATTQLFFSGLLRAAGLGHYLVFRVCVLVLHLTVAALVYGLARRRVGDRAALAPAALIALLGSGSDAFLTSINFDVVSAAAAGLAALWLLERNTRAADLAAMASLAVALASWTSAVAFTAGAFVELLYLGGPGRRRVWVVAVPALLYVGWRLHWAGGLFADVGVPGEPKPDLLSALAHAWQAATGAVAGVLGVQLMSPTLQRNVPWLSTAAQVGLGLLVVGAASWGLRFRSSWRPTPRLAGLAVNGVVLWLLIGVGRGPLGQTYASRYVYAGAVVIVLAAVELAAQAGRPRPVLRLAAGALLLSSLTLGVVWMEIWGNHLRAETTLSRAELGALEIAGPGTARSFAPSPDFALTIVTAGRYFDARRRFGGLPADTPAQLRAAPESAREAADQVLARALDLRLVPGRAPSTSGPPPALLGPPGVRASTAAGCLNVAVPAPVRWLRLLPSSAELNVSPGARAFTIVVARRFAWRSTVALGASAGGRSVKVSLPRGAVADPWRLSAFTRGRVRFCSAR